MEKPKIVLSVFDPEMDGPINTLVLRKIYELMQVEYSEKKDSFTSFRYKCWGISIEDQHDENEPSPHYILKVGEGDFESSTTPKKLFVRYCDYHSSEKGTIITAPGIWRIRVWIKDELDRVRYDIATNVSFAYEQAMIESLKNYEILTSKTIWE